MLMDVVYPYRSAPDDYELRYSLRSLSKLPHRKVVISGDHPAFASEALTLISTDRDSDRYRDSTANLRAAIDYGDLTDDFVVMHDDIFLTGPWSFRHQHRCTIREFLVSGGVAGEYRERVQSTLHMLEARGVEDPLWYGLHTPTVYNRDKLSALLDEFGKKPFLLRTLYHNLYPAPSERADDVKLRQWPSDALSDVLSISDGIALDPSFRSWLETSFPDRSRYEFKARGRCLILGYASSVWDEAHAVKAEFEAVIASPEAAQHRNAPGWQWGEVAAVGRTDEHCLRLAHDLGFDADQIVFCGRQEAREAA